MSSCVQTPSAARLHPSLGLFTSHSPKLDTAFSRCVICNPGGQQPAQLCFQSAACKSSQSIRMCMVRAGPAAAGSGGTGGPAMCTQLPRLCPAAGDVQQLCWPRWKSLAVISSDTGSETRDCPGLSKHSPMVHSTCGLAAEADSPGQCWAD